jgi:hypothetical protein
MGINEPKVTNIVFIQSNILCVRFDRLVLVNDTFKDVTNYQFNTLDGGLSVDVLEVKSDLGLGESGVTSSAYLFTRGGTEGRVYEARFSNIASAPYSYVNDLSVTVEVGSESMVETNNIFSLTWKVTSLDRLQENFPGIFFTQYEVTRDATGDIVDNPLWSMLAVYSKLFTEIGG